MKHLPASQYKGLSFFLSNLFQVLLSLLPKDNHHLQTEYFSSTFLNTYTVVICTSP